jgi:Zn-dependent metalloprotease
MMVRFHSAQPAQQRWQRACRGPNCFLPPHILSYMSQHNDPEVRRVAMHTLGYSEAFRATRDVMGLMPQMAAIPSPAGEKHRLVYDMQRSSSRFRLPGTLIRSEGGAASTDVAVNEAYEYAGDTYDFYLQVFGRNSLDDRGLALTSSVHFSRNFNNAFWNGEQMVYGDGDGARFIRLTKALDVVGHELSHGVVQHTSNLVYQDQSGALNEHFADVMGELVDQWKNRFTVDTANWYMGGAIIAPNVGAQGIRVFTAERAYENNPILGTDIQTKHMRDYLTGEQLEDLIGSDDNGGVHINSGIPNHAFYLVARRLGGHAWEKAGQIWYQTLLRLNANSQFQDAAETTIDQATKLFGAEEVTAVRDAWGQVGIEV